MSRFNVLIVIFDLRTITPDERGRYRKFRKYLVGSGYSYVQESVYVKLIRSKASGKAEMSALTDNAPDDGNVITIIMSLADFKKINFVKGEKFDFSVFSDPVIAF